MSANTGKWAEVLNAFHSTIEGNPAPEKVSKKLNSLSEDAKISSDLTIRQRGAIIDRVGYYLKGEYGNTKRAEHFNHAKPEKK